MRITQDHPEYEKILVTLDNRPCRCVLAADDEEGWVDVPDLKTMAPLDLSEEGAVKVDLSKENVIKENNLDTEEWEGIPIIRKRGKVKFYKMN